MSSPHVLISLHKGYGLGDAMQMSSVLRHIRKYYPDCIIDYQAEEGKHEVGRDIVNNTFSYGQPYPSKHYDKEFQIILYGKWYGWTDRPNTNVSSCLYERFGLDWDSNYGRYDLIIPYIDLCAIGVVMPCFIGAPIVSMHFEGNTAQAKKNLPLDQQEKIRDYIWSIGAIPLLIDWCGTSRLINISSTANYPFSEKWGRRVDANGALISQCSAFIGIDSGPGKCASATSTPSLIIWSGHHPAQFHDPAPNTTHLVPYGYHDLEPVCNNPGVVKWFENNYKVIIYENNDPLPQVKKWLKEILK